MLFHERWFFYGEKLMILSLISDDSLTIAKLDINLLICWLSFAPRIVFNKKL